MTRRNVMIRMCSKRSGLLMDGMTVFFEGDGQMREYYDDADASCDADAEEQNDGQESPEAAFRSLLNSGEEEPEITEMMVEGRLITTTHRVELIYEEELLDGFGTSLTKIGFDRACPSLITLLRSGAVNTSLVFENKKRHICIYNVPAAGFEICISTVLVDNRLLTDGVLVLDYYMEVHGVQTDHCRLELTLTDLA